MHIEWKLTKIGECERFEDIPAGAKVVAIDDKAVIAQCEACGKNILEDEPYTACEDADLCEKCADECIEDENELEGVGL